MIDFIYYSLPEDTNVYFLHHSDNKDGKIKAKTVGKMLDDQLTLEGLFTVVLHAQCNDGKYKFQTNSDGISIAKSPLGMFNDKLIDNDLKMVDETLRKYWEE